MDTRLSLEVVQCRQFDPVSGPFSMNNERKDEVQSVYTVGSQKNLVPIRTRRAYLKRRNQVSTLTVIVVSLLVASLLIIVIALAILYARSSNLLLICETEDCVRIAASLKESMDPTVNPCDDFYQYSCGKWPQEHPIPDSRLTNSWFSEGTGRVSRRIRDLLRRNYTSDEVPWAVMQTKTLFTSCLDMHSMDDLGLAPLFELLKELKIPAVPAALTKETGNYVEQMARVKKILGTDVFFGVDIMQDPRNKSLNIMYLDMPETDSPLFSDKELQKRLQSIRSRLRKLEEEPEVDKDGPEVAEMIYMSEVIREVVNNGSIDVCQLDDENIFPSNDELADVVQDLYDLSGVLSYLSQGDSNETLTDETITDESYMLVDDLQKLTDQYVTEINSSLVPTLIWRPFIEELTEGIVKVDLDRTDKLVVGNLEYVKDIALVLATTEEEILETYVWWVVVDIVVPHASERLRKAWSDYIDKLMSVEVGESRSLECASMVNQLMGMAVSWLYVDTSFHETKAPKVLEMLEDIRMAFASLVLDTDWMDERTKAATLEKNRKMASLIGYPTWIFEEGVLDRYYEDIDLSSKHFLGNVIQVLRAMTKAEWEWLHLMNTDDQHYWATYPTDVNAFHTYQANQITIPAGILQFPFYNLGLEALNYGALGSVLGHELTHGFDNNGRQYDSDGYLRQWWTKQTISEYTDRTQCFIDHYNTYYEDEVDDYIDGELTLGENIADNGGLREAVLAYERWKTRHDREPFLPGFTHLTHEQLLFLSFGHTWCESYTASTLKWMLQDTHCPAHVRLRAAVKNSKEFSTAWQCPVGSNMNPGNKCRLW